MVTNYPQQLTASPAAAERPAVEDDGLFSRALEFVSQKLCGMHGHDSVLHFENNRMLLRCTSCGYDSPGWEVSQRRPHVRYATAEQHRFLLEPGLRKTA
jgi:hypothetical protein